MLKKNGTSIFIRSKKMGASDGSYFFAKYSSPIMRGMFSLIGKTTMIKIVDIGSNPTQ